MAGRIRLPDNLSLADVLDVLDDYELAELAGIAFDSGDLRASAICLRALRLIENAPPPPDPAQLTLRAYPARGNNG